MSEYEKAYSSPSTISAPTRGLSGWLLKHRRSWLILDVICMMLWLVLGLASAVVLTIMTRELSPDSVLTFSEQLFWIGIPAAVLVVGILGIIRLLRGHDDGKWLTFIRLTISIGWLSFLLYECYQHIGPDLSVGEFLVAPAFVGFSAVWYGMIWFGGIDETGRSISRQVWR